MSRTRAQFGLRSRFVAAVVTVLALVTMGGITATPAFAYGDLTLTVYDASTGGLYAEKGVELHNIGGSTSIYNTYPDGTITLGTVPSGDYIANPTDPAYFRSDEAFTIYDSGNYVPISFDKYRVTGSVPAGAGDGHTTATIQQDLGGWVDQLGTFTVSNADDSFSIPVPNGPGSYRVVFHPGNELDYADTASGSFDIVDTAASTDIGLVNFNPAGVISGSVHGSAAPFDAIVGATVHALSGSDDVSATTDSLGNYRIKLPAADASFTLYALAGGYKQQYWDHSPCPCFADAVTLDAGNGWLAPGTNFDLDLEEPDAIINVVGAGAVPLAVDAAIFKLDTGSGLYSPNPWAATQGESSFTFSDLWEGTYRLELSSPTTGVTFPWLSLVRDGNPEAIANGGACFVEFEIGPGGSADVVLADVEVDPTVDNSFCDDPAWADPTDGEVTGTVTNISDLDHSVVAHLAISNGLWLTEIDASLVDPTSGNYTLTGVRDSGDYFVVFEPDDLDPYLPAVLGSGGFSSWVDDNAGVADLLANHPIAINTLVTNDSSGNDISLTEGAIFSGSVMHDTTPVDGCAMVEGVTDPSVSICESTNPDGSFVIKVPIGDEFTLRASDALGEYSEQFWENADNISDATVVGPTVLGENGPFNFDLELSPAQLIVETFDGNDPSYEFTVHLYALIDSEWWEVDTQTTSGGQAYFFTDYETWDPTGLVEGDYRVRVQDDNGDWLAADTFSQSYLMGLPGPTQTGPACSIDLAISDGLGTLLDAWFDRAAQSVTCGPQPLTHGPVTGSLVESPALGGGAIADQSLRIEDFGTGTYYWTTTAADGSFQFDDVLDGTYDLYVPTRDHDAGEHSYVEYEQTGIVTLGGGDLGAIALTRYGNVTGHIDAWDDATMAGTHVQIGFEYVEPDPADNYWGTRSYAWALVDSNGDFEIPGIDVAGQYSVWFDYPNGYVDEYLGGGFIEPGEEFTGVAEMDFDLGTFAIDPTESEIISGTVLFEGIPVPFAMITADAIDDETGVYFVAETDEDGYYEIEVAPNFTYQLAAWHPRFYLQLWNGIDYDGSAVIDDDSDFDPVAVVTDDVGGIDFSLTAIPDVDFAVILNYWDDAAGQYYDLPGLEVHLYKAVAEGWDEVDIQVSDLTSSALLSSVGDGDYRIRFSSGSDWLGFEWVAWENFLPPYSDNGVEGFDPNACFYDFTNVMHGSAFLSLFMINEDPSSVSCGPQQVVSDVAGSLVESVALGSGSIAGQTVELHNNDTDTTVTTTTDSLGGFLFENKAQGDYTITVPTRAHVAGEHSYVEATLDFVVDENELLDPIVLTRFGNASGAVLNWDDASMSGTTAQVFVLVTDLSGSHWDAVGLQVDVDVNGFFEAPGIAVDGDYSVWLDYPTGFVDSFLDGSTGVPSNIFYANAEEDYSGLEAVASTTLSGTVRLGASAFAGVTVDGFASGGANYTTTTDVNGHYSMVVPAGDIYDLVASKTGYLHEFLSNVVVGYAPLTAVDFSMNAFAFEVDTAQAAAPASPYVGAQVHLYKKVSGGWQEVAVDAANNYADFTRTQIGDYRLRFSEGANWLAVDQFQWTNMNNTAETSGASFTDPNPDVCYLDFSTSGRGYYIVHTTVLVSSTVTCAAEPAVVTPPSTPSGTKKHGTPATPDADEAETATPTPTPEPTESTAPADEPSASAVPSPTGGGTDLGWLWYLAGGLVLLILASGGVFIFRRR